MALMEQGDVSAPSPADEGPQQIEETYLGTTRR